MQVYLTFDDGIQEGTEEVLAVLQETQVRATFFLVGLQLDFSMRKNPEKTTRLLKEIFLNHRIANHSYSHAHDQYADYYSNNGIRIDDQGNRRSILMDFEKSKKTIVQLVKAIPGLAYSHQQLFAELQRMSVARLPGRNTWYVSVPGNIRDRTQPLIKYLEADSQTGAEELYQAGYDIFGWNTEWRMTFDSYHDASSDIDRYALENSWKDRPVEQWEEVRNKMLKTAIGNKVILLMHERAFRAGTGKKETAELQSLIEYFKETGATFHTIDEYNNIPFASPSLK
ncbi:polysaccharide deacetylase family protein [Chitinophaga rhizophila]|uniref:Polysaccharide deacetylase family protein n=1 Tax=Chitinophaga rhizophila TaxID=2866212 RepID=A0ABS7G9E5_9BACT|nr:polysaccharide deacetylase family protein [Chitinophaga rhizophila]MBW8683143.1 polysaccharide deacetylase family protein [Chitinophaga rhizophila]